MAQAPRVLGRDPLRTPLFRYGLRATAFCAADAHRGPNRCGRPPATRILLRPRSTTEQAPADIPAHPPSTREVNRGRCPPKWGCRPRLDRSHRPGPGATPVLVEPPTGPAAGCRTRAQESPDGSSPEVTESSPEVTGRAVLGPAHQPLRRSRERSRSGQFGSGLQRVSCRQVERSGDRKPYEEVGAGTRKRL